jgi:hypothetical protein
MNWISISVHVFGMPEAPSDTVTYADQKANCLSIYANEQSDRHLDRPLSNKALPYVTYSQSIQRQGQPISFVGQQTWSYLGR